MTFIDVFFSLFRMKLAVKIAAIILVTSCCMQLCISVPVNPKKTEDPCDLEELESLPSCGENDENCNEMNEKKRAKRQTLCESNPSCGFCGTPIVDKGSLENAIEPEIIDAFEIPSNSSDEDSSQPRKLVERNIIIENDNETQYYRGYVESAANITTVIRLTNLINNTNIINMPTTLNNTNINNIHVYQNTSSGEGGKFGLGYSEKGSCCYAVQPKSCRQSTAGLKCRHSRRKVCGRQCTQKTIHPNSNRNPCSRIPQWPYVNCQQAQPQYQPGFNPGFFQPPAYPGYPPQGYPGYPSQGFPPSFNLGGDSEDDDDFPTDEELEDPESGWVVSPEKCKVVSEDGLQITNCTKEGFEFEHPFARNTVGEPIKRNTRQANYADESPGYQNQWQGQAMPMYYPMYQPVYVQPMPMYMPQYYPPPPPIATYYQPQQISAPPLESFESDEEIFEEIPHKQRKKHVKKHHPVVMDIDEEL